MKKDFSSMFFQGYSWNRV